MEKPITALYSVQGPEYRPCGMIVPRYDNLSISDR